MDCTTPNLSNNGWPWCCFLNPQIRIVTFSTKEKHRKTNGYTAFYVFVFAYFVVSRRPPKCSQKKADNQTFRHSSLTDRDSVNFCTGLSPVQIQRIVHISSNHIQIKLNSEEFRHYYQNVLAIQSKFVKKIAQYPVRDYI